MAKYIGKGTKLYVENAVTADQWDEICFVEITENEPEWGEVETQDSCTSGKVKEFSPTLMDPGTMSFTGIYDDTAAKKAIIASLRSSFDAGDTRNFRIDYEQMTTTERKSFSGFLKKFVSVKHDGQEETLKLMGDIRISGAVTHADV